MSDSASQSPHQILVSVEMDSVLLTVVETLHMEKLLVLLLCSSELEWTGKDETNTEKQFGQPAIFHVSIAAMCPWKRVASPTYVFLNIMFLQLFFFFF